MRKKASFKYSQGMNFITQSLPATHAKQTNLNKGNLTVMVCPEAKALKRYGLQN